MLVAENICWMFERKEKREKEKEGNKREGGRNRERKGEKRVKGQDPSKRGGIINQKSQAIRRPL